MINEDSPLIEFNAHDRCDRCGAQAYVSASREDAGELLFCGHHFNKYESALDQDGWDINIDVTNWEKLAGDRKVLLDTY